MEYYNQLLNLTHDYVGTHLADLFSLEKETAHYVSHGIILFVGAFMILQLISMLTSSSGGNYSPSAPSSSKKFANNQ